MAKAGKITIAEVEEIVPVGTLKPGWFPSFASIELVLFFSKIELSQTFTPSYLF